MGNLFVFLVIIVVANIAYAKWNSWHVRRGGLDWRRLNNAIVRFGKEMRRGK